MGRSLPSARSLLSGIGSAILKRQVLAINGRKKASRAALAAAKAAYEDDAVAPPEGYELAHGTKTLKFYRSKADPSKVLLGVRGTKDFKDVKADAALSFGMLRHSRRYKEDRDAVQEYLRRHPGAKITTSGHSLGGAVARQLARDFSEHVEGGVGYNSAIGLDELLRPSRLKLGKQKRYSTRLDFLRLLSSPFLRKEDRPTVVHSGPSGLNPLTAHKANNFDATQAGV